MVKNLIDTGTTREFRSAHAALTATLTRDGSATEFAAAQWGMLALDSYPAPVTATVKAYRNSGLITGHRSIAA